MSAPLLLSIALLAGALVGESPEVRAPGPPAIRHAPASPAWGEVVMDFGRHVDAAATVDFEGEVLLERITTAVPWPRGLELVDGKLVVLARGRHRNSGGIDPTIADQAGCLFLVDPTIAEPAVIGESPSAAVRENGSILARAAGPPFFLYDPKAGPPVEDTRMDRPYCTLEYDEVSRNFFICGYSGVDLPAQRFRKNATDSIHRFDLRTESWHSVELHDASVVPEDELGYTVPNHYYPHHDPAMNAPPHGWLNGADGAAVAGRYLYVVAKDNHLLARYDLEEVRSNPAAGPPASEPVMGSLVELEIDGERRDVEVFGHSALAVNGGYLYMGFRTSSVVVRFPIRPDGELERPMVGELVAVFEPYDAQTGKTANLMDIAFNSKDELFVSCSTQGRIWKVGVPDPEHVFNGIESGPYATSNLPYVDLKVESDDLFAKTGNIVFDAEDRLYFCSGNYDSGTRIAGVIYRAQELPVRSE